MIKLTKKETNDLLNLIDQTRRDISFGWGGSYGGHDEDDIKEQKESEKKINSSKRAIEIIKKIILEI